MREMVWDAKAHEFNDLFVSTLTTTCQKHILKSGINMVARVVFFALGSTVINIEEACDNSGVLKQPF